MECQRRLLFTFAILLQWIILTLMICFIYLEGASQSVNLAASHLYVLCEIFFVGVCLIYFHGYSHTNLPV